MLPWINFDDYVRTEFSLFLRAKAAKNKINRLQTNENKKEEIVKISRSEIERVDRYIQIKVYLLRHHLTVVHYATRASSFDVSSSAKGCLGSDVSATEH